MSPLFFCLNHTQERERERIFTTQEREQAFSAQGRAVFFFLSIISVERVFSIFLVSAWPFFFLFKVPKKQNKK